MTLSPLSASRSLFWAWWIQSESINLFPRWIPDQIYKDKLNKLLMGQPISLCAAPVQACVCWSFVCMFVLACPQSFAAFLLLESWGWQHHFLCLYSLLISPQKCVLHFMTDLLSQPCAWMSSFGVKAATALFLGGLTYKSLFLNHCCKHVLESDRVSLPNLIKTLPIQNKDTHTDFTHVFIHLLFLLCPLQVTFVSNDYSINVSIYFHQWLKSMLLSSSENNQL